MAADGPCRASTASRLDRIRGQRGVLVHVEIPGMSLNLQDPLLRLTGIHPRQTGGPLFCQILTDFARGGRRANSTPGPSRVFHQFSKVIKVIFYVIKTSRYSVLKLCLKKERDRQRTLHTLNHIKLVNNLFTYI